MEHPVFFFLFFFFLEMCRQMKDQLIDQIAQIQGAITDRYVTLCVKGVKKVCSAIYHQIRKYSK